MKKVVLDAELLAKLKGGRDGVELTDEAGKVVGHYLTHAQYMELVELVFSPLTPEELDKLREDFRKTGGVTTGELLAHIKRIDEQQSGAA